MSLHYITGSHSLTEFEMNLGRSTKKFSKRVWLLISGILGDKHFQKVLTLSLV